MKVKDIITSLGILVTLLLGGWNFIQNYRIGKQTRFINTVTNERIKWVQEIRKNISELSGAIHTWVSTYANAQTAEEHKGEKELLEKIDRLRYLVRLQLNPKDYPDNEIQELIIKLPKLTNQQPIDPVMEALDSLTRKTQILLKAEWEKVKDETVSGRLERKDIRVSEDTNTGV